MVQMALRGSPRLYTNGIAVAQTASDVSLVLLTNENPTGVLSLSYTTAKTVVDELSKAIKNFEAGTDYKVKSIEELDKGLRTVMEKSDAKKL